MDYEKKLTLHRQQLLPLLLAENKYLEKLGKDGLDWGAIKAFCIKNLPKDMGGSEKNFLAEDLVDPLIRDLSQMLKKSIALYEKYIPEKGVVKKYYRILAV
ncbi:MAG: hypothetical protein NZM25_07340 [Leptospiraceae bacterium]|nr:hypothetical protein [Leptospiraceae bacterium]MDW8307133.1 hypothetical protein [Leptospiraceae bacterium]